VQNKVWRVGVTWSVFTLTLGCAANTRDAGERPDSDSEFAATAPSLIEVRGRVLKRREDWSDQEFQRILEEGRSDLPSDTPEVLAAQLRAHVMVNGHYYIELEPDIELATKILTEPSPPPTDGQAPREERTILGTDNRTHWTGALSDWPGRGVGFNNTGGTGVKVAAHSMLTAAHVVYDTMDLPNGWYCGDGTVGNNCSTSPSWRFGVAGTNGFTPWTANYCWSVWVTSGFMYANSSSSFWEVSRWDYAVIDTSACSDGNTGWYGTAIKTDQQLGNLNVYVLGYPDRATCPANSYGGDGSASAGTDCPGTGPWPESTWRLTGAPGSVNYTGAQLWQGSDSSVTVGDVYPDQTLKSNVDITYGDSGAALDWQPIGGGHYVIGVSSQMEPSYNVFNRFTNEVYGFLQAHTPFPQP